MRAEVLPSVLFVNGRGISTERLLKDAVRLLEGIELPLSESDEDRLEGTLDGLREMLQVIDRS